jgi:uncharacterized protein
MWNMHVPEGTTTSQHPTTGDVMPRQDLPDRLRGFALLGIVLVNAPFLGISSFGTTPEAAREPLDRITAGVVVALAQGKFYLLFSFLFGYGLTLMLRRVDTDGIRRYRRRLVGLAVIGLLHGTLLFLGDILLSYALLGALLLLLVRRSDRVVLRWAAAAYVVALALLALLVAAVLVDPAGGSLGDSSALDEAVRGSFSEGVAARVGALGGVLAFLAFFNWAQAFAMFCLGLVAGRRGLLAQPRLHRRLWRRLLLLGLVVGLPCGIGAALLAHGPGQLTPAREVLAAALSFGAAPALSAGYVAAFALTADSRVTRPFARAGRMSLTIYLGESILLSAVFAGWGLGLLGEHGAAVTAGIGLAVWLVLEVSASLWLRRFRYGPFEWLLRAWTYRAWPAGGPGGARSGGSTIQ